MKSIRFDLRDQVWTEQVESSERLVVAMPVWNEMNSQLYYYPQLDPVPTLQCIGQELDAKLVFGRLRQRTEP